MDSRKSVMGCAPQGGGPLCFQDQRPGRPAGGPVPDAETKFSLLHLSRPLERLMAIDEAFNQSVGYYDSWVHNAIPCYDELFNVALENLPFAPGAKIRVLDLGAGTGLFSWHLLKKYPEAGFTLIDLAGQMLDMARKRFQGLENRFEYVTGDYCHDLPEGPYDLIVSSLSIHHLSQKDKPILFKSICDRLNPGGAFVNVDQIKAPTGHFQNMYWDTWLKRVRQTTASEDQIEKSIRRRTELDHDATMADQLSWLQQAGFAEVDCLYHHYFVAVFLALK
jgi:tRNA (cmo5U34)-methyltransferase